jgi:hypothetical protein
MKSFLPTFLAVEPTPKTHTSSVVKVVQGQEHQPDLTQWPWPQILVYTALLALFIFGGPGARLIVLTRFVLSKTIGALVGWLVFLPPALAADESLADPREARCLIDAKVALIRGSDATATLHVALFVAGAGVLSILSTSGLAMFSGSPKMLAAIAVVLIFAGVIVDLVCLLRDYGYATQSYNLSAVGARKSRLVKVASLCFIAGVCLLMIDAWWVQSHQSPASPGWRATTGAFGRTF